MISQETFDLIICDLLMPEVDGNAILEKVKSEMPDIEQPLIANYELAVRMLGFSATELSKSISASPPFLAIKIYP